MAQLVLKWAVRQLAIALLLKLPPPNVLNALVDASLRLYQVLVLVLELADIADFVL